MELGEENEAHLSWLIRLAGLILGLVLPALSLVLDFVEVECYTTLVVVGVVAVRPLVLAVLGAPQSWSWSSKSNGTEACDDECGELHCGVGF